jgi:hypothetical protein
MKRNKLLDLLVEKMGQEEVEFVIPHPLLPPRYRKFCENQNMIVTLDIENTIQLRWENARLSTWMSPTPGEFRTIISYALKKLQKYRRDLQTFGNFVDHVAEAPFQDPIFDDGEIAKAKVAEKKGVAPSGSVPTIRFPFMGGGESPLPTWGF